MSCEFDKIRQFPAAGELLVGSGAIGELPARLPADERYLLVCDPGVAAAGIVDRMGKALDDAKISYSVFDGVCPDPDIATVEAALAQARDEGCGAVIGVGGGSSIDAAKALAARLAHGESLRSYGDGLPVPAPIAPLYAVPTTAGTGSEGTRVAVISDPERMEKMAIRGDALLPRLAILDPDLLASLPTRVAAACGADALTHAIEACVSRNCDPLSEALALAAIELLAANLSSLVLAPADGVAAERCLVGSHLAGRAFAQAGLGLVHSLAEPLGSFCHVEHGLACALLLPPIMEFNLKAAEADYAKVARALGAKAAPEAAAPALRALFAGIGLPGSYAEAGISFTLDDRMIEQVPPQFSTRCNPREASSSEIEMLYRAPS